MSWIGPWEIGSIVAVVAVVITVSYFLALQKAFRACAPQTRTMSPGLVWLQFVPVFGQVWQFIVVSRLAESMQREFQKWHWRQPPRLGRNLGLAQCIAQVCIPVPALVLGFLIHATSSVVVLSVYIVTFAFLVLWISWWSEVSASTRALRTVLASWADQSSPRWGATSMDQFASPPKKAFCTKCGRPLVPDTRFCSACGTPAIWS